MVERVRPICFAVMPFGVKTVEPKASGAPGKIDFDALWAKALAPALERLGYEPVRADQDSGAAIVLEMLERLFFSDLVLADMTLPNGNVYYEIGIRHASRPTGCVLIGADWARPLFDTAQMRRLTYPLAEGTVRDETAAAVRDALVKGARDLADGLSPMYQHIPGYPDPQRVEPNRASAIRRQLDAISAFQGRVRAIRLMREPSRRKDEALAMAADYPPGAPIATAVALEILTVLRDCAGWDEMLEYIDRMAAPVRNLNFVQEQRCLGLSKSRSGSHELAIAAMEELIRRGGDSSERRGIIGGRYKNLADETKRSGDAEHWRVYLDKAIEEYEKGMKLDLNDFYPSANLPFLYRERGEQGDEDKAWLAARVAMLACERDAANEWSKPTQLTLAFFEEDVERARLYAREARREGPAAWKLDTTLDTLARSVAHASDAHTKAALAAVLEELRSLRRQS